ncbi:type I secretion system permease/ATPase [Sphingobium sp. CR2-8]|uniref:type I secretion system permease/ATPase n=1 Tax=Sphingobium sp. CR2-8 TaxID=1306534 RepID=UPI002DBC1202|nr:type I secretion system permease/ATPase [Sphingobium sp. CR2-8]MEC3910175.1 type I secretion system permease/ATPase [Sphingobium sp. CR2-8]
MNMMPPVRPTVRPAVSAGTIDAWLELLQQVAHHYGLPNSEQGARLAGLWAGMDGEQAKVRGMARALGLSVRFKVPGVGERLSGWRLPMIVRMSDGALALVTAISEDGEATLSLAGEGGLRAHMPMADIARGATLLAIARPVRAAPDARVDPYIHQHQDNWLRRILYQDARSYGHVMVASCIANVLGLSGVIFSMQVYDRVVPAESYPTLYILALGVALAIGFDFLLRRLRMNIVDVLGKRADLRMSDKVFGHALRVRNRARPTSTGTFIAQLRDLDQVRELLTSTTVAAIADLPFFLIFLVILWFIGGPLVLVPIAALFLLIVPGLLAQRRLRTYATASMRESSLRNAMLVEAVQGIEDIKALQAEERFQQHWNRYNAQAGEAQLKLRGLTNSLTVWTQNVQNGVYAGIVCVGAPMVIAGDITTGALVASSILGSRMMAPMSQVTALLSRFQQSKVAIGSLNQIMALPVDRPHAEHRISVNAIAGAMTIHSGVFSYADPNSPPALTVPELEIAAGEKIALLGRNGAGKSTLLQALSGMLQPVSGEVLVDNLALGHIDPNDLRRDVSFLSQHSRLFHGTIRENLTLGAPDVSNEEILSMLAMTGAIQFVRRLRAGLEHVILEGGQSLSGGQIQSLLLARLLLRHPRVALLDEPTAAMDEVSERHFIDGLKTWAQDRTLVIATHRMRVLELVDRVIVIDNGTILLDQPRDAALRTMQANKARVA